jgi:hypothetical protein
MARIDVEIDIDDILWGMSDWEKRDLADSLYNDGIVPKALRQELDEVIDRQPYTVTDQELSDLLERVWGNKDFLNSNDLETLRHLSKKGL